MRHDADSLNPPEIYISAEASRIRDHPLRVQLRPRGIDTGSDVSSLPDRLNHILTLYVRWRVWQELSSTQGMNPDPIKLLSATRKLTAPAPNASTAKPWTKPCAWLNLRIPVRRLAHRRPRRVY